jgi:hypothetical protein
MASLQVLGSDKVLVINDNKMIGLAQSFDWTPSLNAKDVMEMGNTGRLATEMELEVSGSFEVSASGAVPHILAQMAVKRTAGTSAFEGYVYDEAGAGGKNAYVFTELDLSEMCFDLLLHERTEQKAFNRSVAFPRVYLTGLASRVDANGSGTSTFNWAGDDFFGAPKPYHDLRSLEATFDSATTATATIGATTGYSLAYVYVNNDRITNIVGDATHATLNAATGQITIVTTEGYALKDTDIIKIWVYKTVPGTTLPSLSVSERATTAYFMKGYTVTAYLAPAVAATPTKQEQWLRAQSIDFNIDLKVEVLRQIGYSARGSAVYARVPTYPLDISLSASVIEGDWLDWKQIMTQTFTGTDWNQDNYNLAPKNLKTSFAIVLDYFTTGGTKLANWKFNDMRPEGMGSRVNIGGRSEISWSFKGSSFVVTGFNG